MRAIVNRLFVIQPASKGSDSAREEALGLGRASQSVAARLWTGEDEARRRSIARKGHVQVRSSIRAGLSLNCALDWAGEKGNG
jgi:hypothetical protein